MARNQVAGQARVYLDGQLLETDGQTKLEIGGPSREPVKGDYQSGSFRESSEPSKVELSVLYKESTELASYRNVTDATIMIEYDTGRRWVVRNAFYGDVASINQADGKASLVFYGAEAEEA